MIRAGIILIFSFPTSLLQKTRDLCYKKTKRDSSLQTTGKSDKVNSLGIYLSVHRHGRKGYKSNTTSPS
jgi:hypothetical protein